MTWLATFAALVLLLPAAAGAVVCNVNAGWNRMSSVTSDVADCNEVALAGADADFVLDAAGEILHVVGTSRFDAASSVTCTAGTLIIDSGVTFGPGTTLLIGPGCKFLAARRVKYEGRIDALAYSGTALGATDVRATLSTGRSLATDFGVAAGDYIRFSWRDAPEDTSVALDRSRAFVLDQTIPGPGEQPLSMNQGRIYRISAVSTANTGPNGLDYETDPAEDYDRTDGVDDATPTLNVHGYLGTYGRTASLAYQSLTAGFFGHETTIQMTGRDAVLNHADLGSKSIRFIGGACDGLRAKVVGVQDYCLNAACANDADPYGECTGTGTGNCDETGADDLIGVAGDLVDKGCPATGNLVVSDGEGIGDAIEIVTPPILDMQGFGHIESYGGFYALDGLRVVRTRGALTDAGGVFGAKGLGGNTCHWCWVQDDDTHKPTGQIVNTEIAYFQHFSPAGSNEHYVFSFQGLQDAESFAARRTDEQPADYTGLVFRGNYCHDDPTYTAESGNGTHCFVAMNADVTWEELRCHRSTDDCFLVTPNGSSAGRRSNWKGYRLIGEEVLNNDDTTTSQNGIQVTSRNLGAGATHQIQYGKAYAQDQRYFGTQDPPLENRNATNAIFNLFAAGNGNGGGNLGTTGAVIFSGFVGSNADSECNAVAAPECCEGSGAAGDVVAPFCYHPAFMWTRDGTDFKNGIVFDWVRQTVANFDNSPGAKLDNVVFTRGNTAAIAGRKLSQRRSMWRFRETFFQADDFVFWSTDLDDSQAVCGDGTADTPSLGECANGDGSKLQDSVLLNHHTACYFEGGLLGDYNGAIDFYVERSVIACPSISTSGGLLRFAWDHGMRFNATDLILSSDAPALYGIGDAAADPTLDGSLVTDTCTSSTGDAFTRDRNYGPAKTPTSIVTDQVLAGTQSSFRSFSKAGVPGICEPPRNYGLRALGVVTLGALGDVAASQLEDFSTYDDLLPSAASAAGGDARGWQ